mmetsp:Transcript_38031/g.83129  ORF Transcript_38031/g.83129 Transcript_38031/m.83129 type:complete len:86 (-) Transcript_38031:66-323(-)
MMELQDQGLSRGFLAGIEKMAGWNLAEYRRESELEQADCRMSPECSHCGARRVDKGQAIADKSQLVAGTAAQSRCPPQPGAQPEP